MFVLISLCIVFVVRIIKFSNPIEKIVLSAMDCDPIINISKKLNVSYIVVVSGPLNHWFGRGRVS
jgi:hypothetical protein